eukprot:CAMPEP_0114546880 /NCGR_PEP_ID=MMETSP0114-20121206/4167_1 /TAXON_ID=31324 /ORGANISM="Goniomonas sp, Strain m" /LENGTH=158 /DNA_ID=CAMNT_0001731399 /DNA_START=41 /DNA_END=517 /DNA_ORIENTATION=+
MTSVLQPSHRGQVLYHLVHQHVQHFTSVANSGTPPINRDDIFKSDARLTDHCILLLRSAAELVALDKSTHSFMELHRARWLECEEIQHSERQRALKHFLPLEFVNGAVNLCPPAAFLSTLNSRRRACQANFPGKFSSRCWLVAGVVPSAFPRLNREKL